MSPRLCADPLATPTVMERDWSWEPLFLRAFSLQKFLSSLGWRPALQGLRASTLRVGREVMLTQFWRK